jgi:hypothetical protein
MTDRRGPARGPKIKGGPNHGEGELDAQRVLALVQNSGRGKTSGLEAGQMRTTDAAVFHIRRGKVTKPITYWERERALADLGLDG